MNWSSNIVFIVLISWSCNQEISVLESGIKSPYIIEASVLKETYNENNIKILDLSDKQTYDKEHIVGAIHISRSDMEDTSQAFAGIMASQTQIENLFSRLGIEIDDTVIIYDNNGLCESSRLWWILHNYNFKSVKLLHGGLSDWKSLDGEVTKNIPVVNATKFKLNNNLKKSYNVSREQMLELLQTDAIIIDTRSFDEFIGKRHKTGAKKAGRIPKSTNIDWAQTVNYDTNKKFKSIEELERIYGLRNVKKDHPIIVYCHSGVRSAHSAFVLTQLLGYNNVKNYDGSWTEWSYFDNLPFENDSLTIKMN